jgi:hypothetical protein
MGSIVVTGAVLKCTFAVPPGLGTLTVLPIQQHKAGKKPIATVMDNKPTANIAPFGMCQAPTNPAVITATAAALGVLTPMPCVPATTSPWAPGALKVKVGKMSALLSDCKLTCTYGGVISIINPGQPTVTGK